MRAPLPARSPRISLIVSDPEPEEASPLLAPLGGLATTASPRSILTRSASEFGAASDAAPRPATAPAADPLPEARAFFARPVPEHPDLEYLESAWRHYRAVLDRPVGSDFSESLSRGFEAAPWLAAIRSARARIGDGFESVPALAMRRRGLALCAEIDAALLDEDGANGLNRDVDALRLGADLREWARSLENHEAEPQAAVEAYARMVELARRHGLDGLLGGALREGVRDLYERLAHPSADADPAAQRRSRYLALRLAGATHAALGEEFRDRFLDARNALLGEADRLEAALGRASEPNARLQVLGELALYYRELRTDVEGSQDVFMQERYRRSLAAIHDEAFRPEVPPALRARVVYETALQLAADGDEARCVAWIVELRGEADLLSSRARRTRDLGERLRLFQDSYAVRGVVGDSAEREAARVELSAALRLVAARAERVSDAEQRRNLQAFLIEAFSGIGEWDAAERAADAIRRDLPEPATVCREGAAAPELSVEDRALWLLRLGESYQRIALGRVVGTEAAPNLSRFREILDDLSGLGARHGRRTMVLYSRLMRALVDNDPAVPRLYEALRDWRPDVEASDVPADESGAVDWSLVAARADGPELARAWRELARGPHEPDLFQRLGARVYEGPNRLSAMERSAPTLQWLSMMAEGNFQQRIHAAAEAGEGTAELRRRRDELRDTLTRIQGLILSGRASGTREAIRLLPEITGNEDAAQNFYREMGRIFEYRALDGSLTSMSSPISDLIDTESIADPNARAARRLSVARVLIREDSIHHRCDAAIASLLQTVEASGQPGYAPPSLESGLREFFRGTADIDVLAGLYNRAAGNLTLRDQVASTRASLPYWQATNQLVDHLFSVEGGAIVVASLFTAGLAAELAGGALALELGVEAATVSGRMAIGLTRFGAMYATLNTAQFGLTGLYRAAEGRPQMTAEQARLQLITSFFSLGVGELFSAGAGTVLPGLLRGAGLSGRSLELGVGAGRFMAFNEGMVRGEDLAGAWAGVPVSRDPHGVRLFRATVDGALLSLGAHTARSMVPLAPREGLRVVAEGEAPRSMDWQGSWEAWREAFRSHALGMAFMFTGMGVAAFGVPVRRSRVSEGRVGGIEGLYPAAPEAGRWWEHPDLVEAAESGFVAREIVDVHWPAEGSAPEAPLRVGESEPLRESQVNQVLEVLEEVAVLADRPVRRLRLHLEALEDAANLQLLVRAAREHGMHLELRVGPGETIRIDGVSSAPRLEGLSLARLRALPNEALNDPAVELRLASGERVTGEVLEFLRDAMRRGRRFTLRDAEGGVVAALAENGLALHAERVPEPALLEAIRGTDPTRPLRVFVDGRPRLEILPGAEGRRSVNAELSGADAATAQRVLALLAGLHRDCLSGAFVQVQNLPAVSEAGIRRELAALTRRGLEAGVQRLTVTQAGARSGSYFLRLTRNQPVVRLAYQLETSQPVSALPETFVEYLAHESAAWSPELAALHRDGLARMWTAALAHVEAFSRNGRERESYQRYWSEPNSATRWLQGLQTLVSYGRSGSANAARLRRALGNILEFSEPAAGGGLLGYEPFVERALGDNAFELMRIGEQDMGTLTSCLENIAGLMGRNGGVELGGAFVGLVYKAVVAGDGAARHEVEALRDQIREAGRIPGERFRFTVLPEDRETRVTTPEWVVQRLDASGRPVQLLAAEVKAINVRDRGEAGLGEAIRKGTRQLTTHLFTDGAAEPRAMLVLRLSHATNRGETTREVRRILDGEFDTLSRSGESSLRRAAERMRAMDVRVYFETGPEAVASSVTLSFRNGHWEVAAGRETGLAAALGGRRR